MRLYEIKIYLSAEGYTYMIEAYEVTETKSAYKWTGKLIKKSLLNKIDSVHHNYGSFMRYTVWSLGEDVPKNKEALLNACQKQIDYLLETTHTLNRGADNPLGHKIHENF
jgi:argonaute-like protein implicated in RNA metabolism and viral defense